MCWVAGCQSTIYGDWQLSSIEGESIAEALPESARLPTLSVTEDGRVAGVAGVNRFTGSLDAAALADGRFSVGPMAMTRMAGPPEAMAFEDRFIRALERVNGFEVAGGELGLLDSTDTPVMVFEGGDGE